MLDDIQLQSIRLAVVLTQQKLVSIGATIAFTKDNGWPVLDGLIVFEGLAVGFTYFPEFKSVTTLVDCSAKVSGGTLTASIGLPNLEFGCELEEGQTINIAQLVKHLVGDSVSMPQITCTKLKLFGQLKDRKDGQYRFQAAVSDNWTFNLGSKPLSLTQIGLDFSHTKNPASTSANLLGIFAIAGAELAVGGEYATQQGWTLTAGTFGEQNIPLTTLLDDVLALFGVDFPANAPAMALKNLNLIFNTLSHDFTFRAMSTLDILNVSMEIDLEIAIVHPQQGSPQKTFKGFLWIQEEAFEIDYLGSDESKTFSAQWSTKDQKHYLQFQDIASAFGFTPLEIPPDLDLSLENASFTYDFTDKTLVLEAQSVNYGKAVFVALKNTTTGKWQFFFGLEVNAAIALANLPLVNHELPSSETLAIKDFHFTIASATFDKTLVNTLRGLIPNGMVQLPNAIGAGVELSTILQLGATTERLGFPISAKTASEGNPETQGNAQPSDGNTTSAIAPSTPSGNDKPASDNKPASVPSASAIDNPESSSGDAKWFTLEKSFEPVYLQQIGVSYRDSFVSFLLDASLSVSALKISLDGLSVGSPISDFKPQFNLDGLGISYITKSIQITGALLAAPGSGLGSHNFNYEGEAIVKTETFSLGAEGAYTVVNGHPSLFVFVLLDEPLGGPPFFFVTGLAGGFGYNRRLKIPSLDGVKTFPLVQAATGQDNPFGSSHSPTNALQVMQTDIPVAVGTDWLAAGVNFTSFEMVTAFALLTAELGTQFEIALLGMAKLSVPTGASSPIGMAQMVLDASFSTATGLLAVSAKLTPASYILSEKCHLTGGFAFYIWFSGDREGDFVATLGGYSPYFNKPAYYPDEPQLGFNWNVTDNLNLKGGMYFALTPAVVMAGGDLEATWQSGDLKAWFDADADFLLGWKPFHYDIHSSVNLGASYKVNLLLTSFRVTVHVGVSLHLYGPSFAGSAIVHLSVFSFTIRFGQSNPSSNPISWSAFTDSFFPDTTSQQESHLTKGKSRDTKEKSRDTKRKSRDILSVKVANGLVKDLRKGKSQDPDEIDYIVNPAILTLVTKTLIPAKTATFNSMAQRGTWNTNLGVLPVGIAANGFISKHQVTIADEDGNPTNNFQIEPAIANSPTALWGTNTPRTNNPAMISNTLVGFTIKPTVMPPDKLLPIKIANLQYSTAPKRPSFTWSAPDEPTTESFNPTQAMKQLEDTIDSPEVAKTRHNILASLNLQGLKVNENVDVSNIVASARDALLAPPVLSLLGEAHNS
ncbi:MAG: DUF6603 domain-containing protein [Cyanobacteria bacterium P01_G01_bin.54]